MDNPEIVKAVPCHSCGKQPHTFKYKDADDGEQRFEIWCATMNCGEPIAIKTKVSMREAIILWNKAQAEKSHENLPS